MIATAELRRIADAKLADAVALHQAGRYDNAVYLGGYAVELALKARICDTLGWAGYPETGGEFHQLQSFRTHDLGMLLHLSGRETRIKNDFPGAWRIVSQWSSAARYLAAGSVNRDNCLAMLDSVALLVEAI